MDIEALVTEIRLFFQASEKEKGPYWLVMIVAPGAAFPPRKWNLVLSAPWIDALGDRPALMEIVRGLKSALSLDAQSAIERLSVLRTNEPFVCDIGQLIRLRTHNGSRASFDYEIVENAFIDGYDIPYGVVILSHLAQERTVSKPGVVKQG